MIRRLTILLALAMASLPATAAAPAAVLDGDTLVYDGRQVEIWGIIAPLKSEICMGSDGKSWNCGERVFEELSRVAADRTFACIDKEPGFVTCRAAGLDVGLLHIKEGLARARQAYQDDEVRAREAKVGIWQ